MLLTQAEMTFDFGGARFDPVRDRELLAFIFSQFLYGEVTGIQVGTWLHQAPDLESATFLARQATEEMAHVRSFLEIFRLLGAEPHPPHGVVRFLATDWMGGSFAEHTCLEMALGEGFVLQVIYALIDTIDHPGIVRVLAAAAPQEERHVSFGEDWTREAVAKDPGLGAHLLGLSLVSLTALDRMAPHVSRLGPTHPVLRQLPAFVRATAAAAELRLERMGIARGPIAQIGRLRRVQLTGSALLRRTLRPLGFRRRRLLTDTYLSDPLVRGEASAPDRS